MVSWSQPLQFIYCDDEKNLKIEENAKREIEKIEKVLQIVSCVGPARNGKSTLFNRLAKQNSGFPTDSSLNSKTKGIWAWYIDHPNDETKGILLLDTEGLYDTEKSDPDYDMKISCLTILFSSMFVFNYKNLIDSEVIKILRDVTFISKHVRTRANDNSDVKFDEFLPHLVVTIRDFTLLCRNKNRDLTEDEYLEETMFKPVENPKEEERQFNDVVKTLRYFFPASKRKLFLFVRPVQDKDKLNNLENVTDDELQLEFIEKSNEFCEYVYKNAFVKTIDRVNQVNGFMFANMAELYVQTISSGFIDMGNITEIMAEKANKLAFQESVELYNESMKELSAKRLMENKDIEQAHLDSVKNSISLFLKKSFLDTNEAFKKELMNELDLKYSQLVNNNNTMSLDFCKLILKQLYLGIQHKINQGIFYKPGGSINFFQYVEALKKAYENEKSKGAMAKTAWEMFYRDCLNKGEMFVEMDQALSQKAKIVEKMSMKEKRETIEKENKEDELKAMKEHLANITKAHQEEVILTKESCMKADEEKEIQHRRRITNIKTEINRLLKEGNDREAERRKQEIEQLEIERQNERSSLKEKLKMAGKITLCLASVGLLFVSSPIAISAGIACQIGAQLLDFI